MVNVVKSGTGSVAGCGRNAARQGDRVGVAELVAGIGIIGVCVTELAVSTKHNGRPLYAHQTMTVSGLNVLERRTTVYVCRK